MTQKHTLIRFITSCFLISFLGQAEATIVRMDFDYGAGTVTDQVYIELFDSKAPGTVANFLNYVENSALNPVERRYENTLIHRSVTGFIVQGGSFTFDSEKPGGFSEKLVPIAQYSPIANEFDPSDQERSNIRGTMAMAKTSKPDSATSGWFYNLANNSSSLDDPKNSGGFTVFARVLCNTAPAPTDGCDNMDIVDKFATADANSLSIEALAPFPLDTVPLVNHTAGTPVATANLIRLTNVEVLNLIQPSALDFEFSPIGSTKTRTITVENQTDFAFTVLSVAKNILPPFSILSEDCTTRPSLGPVTDPLDSRTCSITVSYQPTQAGENSSSFQIKTDHAKLPSLTVWVSSTSTPQAPTISFSPELGPTLQFGSLGPDQNDKVFELTISNLGIDVLTIETFDEPPFTGTGTENLALISDCTSLATGDSCTVSITFSLLLPAIATEAQLEIRSNDPQAPSSIIQITGSTGSDNDGVPDAIEAAVSSSGDGNLDGIADALQDNVASLPDFFGRYVTLEAEPGVQLAGVEAIDSPAPDTTPRLASGTLDFRNGFFSFQLENVPVGGTASVTLYLPEGQTATHYFKFGRLPSDVITRVPDLIALPPHWYSFDYNGDTGAEIQGNRITLHFRDGGRGDDDLTADGRIVDPGGPAVASASSDSSGGGGGGCSLSSAADSGKSLPVDFVLLLISLFTLRHLRKRCLVH